MIKNYFKIAIRNLFKNKLHSTINIVGLSVGLAVVMCIAIYLQNELSYDQFHVQKDQLYRVGIKSFEKGIKLEEGYIYTPPIGPAMKEELAGVKNYTRYNTPREAFFSTAKKSLKTDDLIYADSSFFSLFSFPLLAGIASDALTAPYSLVLTEDFAISLFGYPDALGKTVRLNNGTELQVTAIAASPPSNSHIQFQAVISFSTLYQNKNNYMGWNGGQQYITYVQLDENTNPVDVEQQFPEFMWRHINKKYETFNLRLEASLQPLTNLHLQYNSYSSSLRTNLFIIGGMALLILIIACINFINMTTARAGRRAREVGVRKVLGASRASLGWQFLGETFMLIGIAFFLSLLLVEAVLPFLPNLFGKALDVSTLFRWTSLGGLLLLLILVGLCAGAYPSLYLSSFDTVKTLKGLPANSGKSILQNGLVVFQFAVSIVLIISTLIINQQLEFTKSKSLGFDQENVLILPLLGKNVQSKIKALKQELKKSPKIKGAAACSEPPGRDFTQNGYQPEGQEDFMLIKVVDVDDDYFHLFDLQMSEGRELSTNKPQDQEAYLINETLAQQLNWTEPIGKKISRDGEYEIIGVVKDFHYASMYKPIEPLIITCAPQLGEFDYLTVKLAAGKLEQGVQAVQQAWQQTLPGIPMDFWFLDDAINQIYQTERNMQEAFFWSSGLSIFIALIGIFGLTAFAVEQRKKEIGIRKILGASVANLAGLFSKDFLKLVLIALVIAAPIAWYLMNQWLGNFAFRIDIQWGVFAFAGVMAISIALLTVSFQSVKAALANPINALNNE